jgi:hypothetical protein
VVSVVYATLVFFRFYRKEAIMGGISVNERNAPEIESVEEMVGRFQAELMTFLPQWKDRLAADPSGLEELERDVHQMHARGADLLIAGLVAIVMKRPDFEKAAKQTRQAYRFSLARGTNRKVRIRLLGGLVIWVASLYCAPRKRLGGGDHENVPGLYIEHAQFGFGKGCSPALQSRVARQAALSPSLNLAQQELQRNGLQINVKTVDRITRQCGEGLLALRRHELLQWRAGKLPAGAELAHERVSVQIDGGRTKLRGELRPRSPDAEELDEDGLPRENVPGRSKKRAKKTFDADWREPKLVTIFVHDEKGRMKKKSQALLEGSFLGPDAVAELVAMHLHRLGAAQAQSVTFVSDGAPWIWDRLPVIVEMAKLKNVTVHEVLDCCHAAHHISLALAALGLNDQERMPLYREHRSLLRNGQWRRVVEELGELAGNDAPCEKLQTELAYLRKHGEAGRLKYPYFRSLGLPLGSGAIESSIRRVINLRLKGNGIFWRQENAEAMLQVRSQVISDRWDDRIKQMRKHLAYDGRSEWRFQPRPMSSKAERAAPASLAP